MSSQVACGLARNDGVVVQARFLLDLLPFAARPTFAAPPAERRGWMKPRRAVQGLPSFPPVPTTQEDTSGT